MVKAPRTFPAPAVLGGGSYTVDELEVLSHGESNFAVWARKTYRSERDAILASLSDDTVLPHGVVEVDEYGFEYVTGLDYDGGVYTHTGWVDEAGSDERMELDADETAFVARAFNEGIDRVYLRPVIPAAWIDADTDEISPAVVAAAGSPTDGLPANAQTVAVVDELDKNAVLDLIAVAPGPKVWRRHDGGWQEDARWLNALKSVKPPPLVKVADELLAKVTMQVDQSTAGQPFDGKSKSTTASASSLLAAAQAADDEAAVMFALLAAKSPAKSAANKAAGAERLRQYWLHGKGAAKIRWGTKGAWTRCYKHLSKYLGPRAKGYCQLMHGRATGTWAGRGHSKVPNPAVKARAIAKQLQR